MKSRGEFLQISILAIAILAFTSIPYWAAKSAETNDLVFRGAFFDEVDYAVHISMMQAGRMGDWAYEMRFTSEPHRPAYIRLFYIILGHVSRWIHLDVEPTYHLARWLFGFLALLSIYQLCTRFFQAQKDALTAFLFCSLAGGAGWIQILFNSPTLATISPIDFWLIDAYIFFSVSVFPSFSFTLALMATAISLFMDFLQDGKWRNVFATGLLAVICQAANPIAFAAVDIAIAGAVFFRWAQNKKIEAFQLYALTAIALAQIPLLAYNFLVLNRDPIWSQFTAQNQTLSPPFEYYLWGFAPFWLPAIYGIVLAFRQKRADMAAMSAWVAGGFVLAYMPFFIQRRFLLGITIPLGILAIYGIQTFTAEISTRSPAGARYFRLVLAAYLFLSLVSFLNLGVGSGLYMKTLPVDNFHPRDLENALQWLDENATPNDFALGEMKTGQLVAQRTKLKAYFGHPMETLSFFDKADAIEAFYRGEQPAGWIQQTPIQWVVYGIYEKDFSPTFTPSPSLELAYENEFVSIYRVVR